MKFQGGRPYPSLRDEWSTEKWRSIPGVYIEWTHLTLTQQYVYTEVLADPDYKHSYCGDEYPHVVRYNGENYVEDGHHRLIKQYLSGHGCAYVRMIDLDKNGNIVKCGIR